MHAQEACTTSVGRDRFGANIDNSDLPEVADWAQRRDRPPCRNAWAISDASRIRIRTELLKSSRTYGDGAFAVRRRLGKKVLTVPSRPDLKSKQLVALNCGELFLFICGKLFPETHTFDRSFRNPPCFDNTVPGNSYLFQRTKSVSSGPYVLSEFNAIWPGMADRAESTYLLS